MLHLKGGNEIQKIKNPALFPPAENPSSSLSKTPFLSFFSLDSQTTTASLLHIVLKVAAQVPDSGPCATYIGEGGSGNFVKMVHNEIEYGELQSFLIEITADIFDKVLDKTGMKGTGKWTVQQAADLSIAAPTIATSLDSRFQSGLKDVRVEAAKIFKYGGFGDILETQNVDKR
ncbi:unnamed protein product [Lactuca virosa]|uniref:phosphogluconate dehydrogenase (NADP(+)-dependent, decarboxylating) n=1 Tax=Lactuca virosa TaxID=75947 RepID=A0AAU9LEM3_9ASTR|nr:unnamed protein product [Lactuca virosa]